jgi:hypothetical protein
MTEAVEMLSTRGGNLVGVQLHPVSSGLGEGIVRIRRRNVRVRCRKSREAISIYTQPVP